MFEVFDALDPAVDSVRPPVRVEQLDDDFRRVLQEPVADFLDDLGARVGRGCRRSETRTMILKKRLECLPNDSRMSDNIPHATSLSIMAFSVMTLGMRQQMKRRLSV